MATRINSRMFNITLEDVPAGLDPDMVKKLIQEAVAKAAKTVKAAPVVAAKPAKAPIILRNRTVKKKNMYPCTLKPAPLMASAILWPTGVPHEGCGRTFGTAKMRDAHMAGFTDSQRTRAGWLTKRFPNQCLDAIVPADKRDSR